MIKEPSNVKTPAWLCVTGQKIKFLCIPIGKFIIFCLLAFATFLKEYCPKFAEGISSFFSFFWNMFMAWKNKNCPAIIWKD